MLRVGLTGGIAAGKSIVGEMFVALGAKLIRADDIAHQLMQPGEDVYERVVQHFGIDILNPDGTVNRPRLAQAAFGSGETGMSSRISELNRIVHPTVMNRQEEWMAEIGRREPSAIAIVEAALILEAGMGKRFDRLVVVTCRPDQRVERWARQMNVNAAAAAKEVTRRMAAQFPEPEKIKAADYVIDNSGSLDQTREQVRNIYNALSCDAAAKNE